MSFARYIGVDWSGAKKERGGVAVAQQFDVDEEPQLVEGISTRKCAVDWILGELTAGKGPVFVGLDFCFGYPAGAAKKVFDVDQWLDLPRAIGDLYAKAGSARKVALAINSRFVASGPFRMARGDRNFDFYLKEEIQRYRVTELFAPGALSAWDAIAGPQVALSTLTGIAALADLIDARRREESAFKVFPFEPHSPGENVLAEVYPGLAPRYGYKKGDKGDALRITRWVYERDSEGKLFNIPSLKRRFGENWDAIIKEEGWIAGLTL